MKWFWIILALLYVISRIDLIPDMIPVYGWIDDIVVLIYLFRYLGRQRRRESGQGSGLGGQSGRTAAGSGRFGESLGRNARADSPKSPYEILNVPPTADAGQIRAAYRKLAGQYHPDKVAHLGREFQELAEERFKEIQQAYETLAQRAGGNPSDT